MDLLVKIFHRSQEAQSTTLSIDMADFRTWYNSFGHEDVPRNMISLHKQRKEEAKDIILEFDPTPENSPHPTKEVAWSDNGPKKATFKGFQARDVSALNGWKAPGGEYHDPFLAIKLHC